MVKNEINLNKNGNFVTRYGTTIDNETPPVVYLRTKSKITPFEKKKEYNDDIARSKDEFALFAGKYLSECESIDCPFLFNIDISPKGVKYGKTSFLRYDVYLRPKERNTLKANQEKMEEISLTLDENLERILKNNGIICK